MPMVVLTYKAVHWLLPPYFAGDCRLVSTTRRRQLGFSDINLLIATLKPQSNGPSDSNTVYDWYTSR